MNQSKRNTSTSSDSSGADSHGSEPVSDTGELDLLGESPIWTPEIARLSSNVCAQVRMGFPGMAVDGPQRCGKTLACEYLRDTLSEALGYPVACFLWSIPESCKTERDFIQERLRDSECHAIFHRDSAVLRIRLYDHIADFAAQLGSNKVIIIVDEAQNLTREQYHYLTHCDNNLRKRKIKPFFLLVGQPELRSAPTSWVQSSGFHVVGRFFSRQHTYMGIAVADLFEVITGFDEPEAGSSVATYAKAIPDAYEAGWRLSQVSPLLVEAIATVAAKHNITSGVRVPMQNLRAMLLSILYYYIDTRQSPQGFNALIASNAVNESGFPSVLQYYVQPQDAALAKKAA